jgi:hypothetical protein
MVALGAAFKRSFTYVQADGTSPDLTGWTALMVCKRFPSSREAIFSLASGTGITLGPNGSIVLALTADQTSAIVLPKFMGWGPYPQEGTGSSPNDVSVSGRLAIWELHLTSGDGAQNFIPLSGTICFREGATSPLPAPTLPFYKIFVEPQESTVSWDSNGYQDGAPLVLSVTIVRYNGHSAPINIALPEMEGSWVGWVAIINGAQITQLQAANVPFILDAAPDTFTMEFSGTQAGWSLQNWQGGVQVIGDDGSGELVRSNVFSVIF